MKNTKKIEEGKMFKEKNYCKWIVLSLVLVGFVIKFGYSAVPNKINYQGRLRYQGQPVSGTKSKADKRKTIHCGSEYLYWLSHLFESKLPGH